MAPNSNTSPGISNLHHKQNFLPTFSQKQQSTNNFNVFASQNGKVNINNMPNNLHLKQSSSNQNQQTMNGPTSLLVIGGSVTQNNHDTSKSLGARASFKDDQKSMPTTTTTTTQKRMFQTPVQTLNQQGSKKNKILNQTARDFTSSSTQQPSGNFSNAYQMKHSFEKEGFPNQTPPLFKNNVYTLSSHNSSSQQIKTKLAQDNKIINTELKSHLPNLKATHSGLNSYQKLDSHYTKAGVGVGNLDQKKQSRHITQPIHYSQPRNNNGGHPKFTTNSQHTFVKMHNTYQDYHRATPNSQNNDFSPGGYHLPTKQKATGLQNQQIQPLKLVAFPKLSSGASDVFSQGGPGQHQQPLKQSSNNFASQSQVNVAAAGININQPSKSIYTGPVNNPNTTNINLTSNSTAEYIHVANQRPSYSTEDNVVRNEGKIVARYAGTDVKNQNRNFLQIQQQQSTDNLDLQNNKQNPTTLNGANFFKSQHDVSGQSQKQASVEGFMDLQRPSASSQQQPFLQNANGPQNRRAAQANSSLSFNGMTNSQNGPQSLTQQKNLQTFLTRDSKFKSSQNKAGGGVSNPATTTTQQNYPPAAHPSTSLTNFEKDSFPKRNITTKLKNAQALHSKKKMRDFGPSPNASPMKSTNIVLFPKPCPPLRPIPLNNHSRSNLGGASQAMGQGSSKTNAGGIPSVNGYPLHTDSQSLKKLSRKSQQPHTFVDSPTADYMFKVKTETDWLKSNLTNSKGQKHPQSQQKPLKQTTINSGITGSSFGNPAMKSPTLLKPKLISSSHNKVA